MLPNFLLPDSGLGCCPLLLKNLSHFEGRFFFFFPPDGFRTLKFWDKSALTPTLKNANKLFNNEAPEEESLL